MEGAEVIQEIPALVLKNLIDRSYEKRKAAAGEIESIIHQMHEAGDSERIRKIIRVMTDAIRDDSNLNSVKGGLIGLASCGIGVGTDIINYISLLLPPVLDCFDSEDTQVRFYACESLYNIVKAARGGILTFINEIFSSLCELYADVDVEVKEGASLLDKLLKEIVTETQSFDVEKLIPLMQQYIYDTSPHIRRLLISWIDVMDNVPGIDILDFLPGFLEGLFDMLSDPHREIRQETDSLLQTLLAEIKESTAGEVDTSTMITTIIVQSHNKDKFIRLTAVSWIREFVLVSEEWSLPYSQLFDALLPCLLDEEEEVQQASDNACKDLMDNFMKCDYCDDLRSLVTLVCNGLSYPSKRARLVCLRFTAILLTHSPAASARAQLPLSLFRSSLLSATKDGHDEVIEAAVEVLLQYARRLDDLPGVLRDVMEMLRESPAFLERRGSFILCMLCRYEDSTTVYHTVASILSTLDDRAFVGAIVQLLVTILLTQEETRSTRDSLRSCLFYRTPVSPASIQLYDTLYQSFCVNPIAALCLCLFVEDYCVAESIAFSLNKQTLSMALLLQANQLLSMLDSPMFMHIRLHLIDIENPSFFAMLRSIYAFLMILPQSKAYNALQNRLSSLTPLYFVLNGKRCLK
ncbi:VAC14 family protein [Blastocystis sp. ATCC 50177/Nand II]|uniref:VAC14 family protein n=1 Tax=Blastocystis sp. subtype 1 (strain ATCC 50177 / NandII) TaxID=478820 RepID=A0A196SN27_BLAHN|nr:VAC14 family protein [Blastocystis sp. ATCC 50177/Nand II]